MRYIRQTSIKTLAATTLMLPVLAFAFENTLQKEQLWLQEETFVISASKFKEDIKKTPASVTVIDADMIEKMGAQTLSDALRAVPGLWIHPTNWGINEIESRGIKTSFSEKVMILMDGHLLNFRGATAQYDQVNLDNVKRIEVVRGPASALYGDNAFTALINIITKDAKDIDGVEASIQGGSFNTKTFNLLFGKVYNDLSISGNINITQTDGYDPYIAADYFGRSGNADISGERQDLHLKLDYKGFYFMSHYMNKEKKPFLGIYHALAQKALLNYESFFVEAGYKTELSKNTFLHLRAYYDQNNPLINFEASPPGFPAPVYTEGMLRDQSWDISRKGVEIVGTYKGDNFVFVSGMLYEKQDMYDLFESQNFDPLTMAPYSEMVTLSKEWHSLNAIDRNIYAFYGELIYDLTKHLKLTLGARYDHFSEFGGTVNPRTGLVWEANANNIFKIMYGEAFRAPSFSEIYNVYDATTMAMKRPEFDPEKIKTVELGWQNSSLDRAEFKMTLFRNEITDLITYNNAYNNEGGLEVLGLEAEMKYNLGRGSFIVANYTYQEPQDDYDKALVSGISRHKAYVGLNYRINETYNLYVDANYRSEQARSEDDTQEPIEGMIIANATLLAKELWSDDLTLKFSINNLFNEKLYQTSAFYVDYPLPERSFMAELKYKF